MSPLRVLLSSHGASLFGAERVLLAIAGGLAARGHSITLEFPHEGPAVEAARVLRDVRVVVSGRVRLPRNSAELLRFAAFSPSSVRTMQRLLAQETFDAAWINSMYNAHAALAARAARVPAVWHLHERCFGGAAGAVMRRVVHALSRVAVAPSRFVAASFGAARVLPNALLADLTPLPPVHGQPPRIGYIGQLEPRKRAPDLIAAIEPIRDATAVLIGDGKARDAVETAIDRHGVRERVVLTGFRADIRDALDGCTCVVIPSRDEPFGLVALEAMALGLPVIATRSGALPDVLADAALYYPVGDVAALRDCIRQLAGDEALRTQLRLRGLERVRSFSVSGMLDGVEDVLRSIVHPHAAQVA